MKILFVVKGLSIVEPMGVMQLSAVAKKLDCDTDLLVLDEQDILAYLEQTEVDVLALSFLSTEARVFRETVEAVRQHHSGLLIIAGGPHPTYFPEIAQDWPIDVVFRGEGDLCFDEFLRVVAQKKPYIEIPNVVTRDLSNRVCELVSDLDLLPFPDRSLIEDRAPFKYLRMRSFFATRGCPFNCSYCFNSAYHDLYRGLGTVFRRRSVENLLEEIVTVKEKYPTDFIRFGDDVFVTRDDQWLDAFVEGYRERVRVPFYCLIRPNIVNESIIKKLKYAGCHSVSISLECSNQELREVVLQRRISNEQIRSAYGLLKQYGIHTFSNVMLGLPGATIKDDLDSLRMTLELNPTYASFTIFTPFPGTELHRYCRENGHLKADFDEDAFPESTFQESILVTVTKDARKVQRNIMMLGALANYLPWSSKRLCKWMVRYAPNPLFSFIGFMTRNILQKKIWPVKTSWWGFVKLVVRVIRLDLSNYKK